jgi:hypothetical protein
MSYLNYNTKEKIIASTLSHMSKKLYIIGKYSDMYDISFQSHRRFSFSYARHPKYKIIASFMSYMSKKLYTIGRRTDCFSSQLLDQCMDVLLISDDKRNRLKGYLDKARFQC